MNLEAEMTRAEKKAAALKKTAETEKGAKPSRILNLVRATLNRQEREKIADLVEREEWSKRLSF